MPNYEFFCHACKKTFSKSLTIAEHEKGNIVCPHCRGKNVERLACLLRHHLEEERVSTAAEFLHASHRNRDFRRRHSVQIVGRSLRGGQQTRGTRAHSCALKLQHS